MLLVVVLIQKNWGQELGSYSFIPISGTPHDVVYDSARDVAYVSNRTANRIDVVSLNNQSILSSILVGNKPTGMALTPNGTQLLVTLYNEEKMGVVDLNTQTQVKTINLPPGLSRNDPLRVDFDAAGTCFWRDGSGGNPYGYAYTLDLPTGISTRLLPFEPDVRYASNMNQSRFLYTFTGGGAAIWNADTQIFSPRQSLPGFGSSHSNWPVGEAINNTGDTLLITRASSETFVFDDSFNSKGSVNVGMGWGTFGCWDDLAIMVECQGASPLNRISILNTESISIVDTLILHEQIGVGGEFDYGSNPIALTDDCRILLAVGQTGLYIIDTSNVPEPSSILLFAMGAVGLLKRSKRKYI